MTDTNLSTFLSELEEQYMQNDPILSTLNNSSDIENPYIPQGSLANFQDTTEQSATWTDHEKREITEKVEGQGNFIAKVSTSRIRVVETRLHTLTVNQSRTAQLRHVTHNLEVRLGQLHLQVSDLRHASIRGHSSRRHGRWELVVPALENRIAVLECSIEELRGELKKKVQACVGGWEGKDGASSAERLGTKRDREDMVGDEGDDILAMGRARKRLRLE